MKFGWVWERWSVDHVQSGNTVQNGTYVLYVFGKPVWRLPAIFLGIWDDTDTGSERPE